MIGYPQKYRSSRRKLTKWEKNTICLERKFVAFFLIQKYGKPYNSRKREREVKKVETVLLTSKEVQGMLKIGRTTLWKLEKHHKIRPVQKLLPTKRYRLSDIEKIIKEDCT